MPKSPVPLVFTGERLTSDVSGDIVFEHWHRYMYAESYCVDRDVLDIASGEGYGSAFLAQTSKSVVGVDIDDAALAHARKAYKAKNLSFVLGSATKIPLEDNSIDVVCSMETLEHLPDQEQFIAEIGRVLRPSGVLILSSPNVTVYSAPFEPVNIHHVKELFRDELALLVGSQFLNCQILGQSNISGNALLPLDQDNRGSVLFNQHIDNRFGVFINDARSQYYLMIASNADLELPRISILNAVHFNAARSVHFEQLTADYTRLENDLAEVQRSLKHERTLGDTYLGTIKSLQDSIEQLSTQISSEA